VLLVTEAAGGPVAGTLTGCGGLAGNLKSHDILLCWPPGGGLCLLNRVCAAVSPKRVACSHLGGGFMQEPQVADADSFTGGGVPDRVGGGCGADSGGLPEHQEGVPRGLLAVGERVAEAVDVGA